MRHTLLASAIGSALTLQPYTAQAAGADPRLEALEQRLERLEHGAEAKPAAGHWTDRIGIAGLVEIEASYNDTEGEKTTSDLDVATVELGFGARINDWTAADVVFLYEGEGVEVDIATITLAQPDGAWSLVAGRQYVPFGSYETALVSDPLTLEVGETSEAALVGGYQVGGLTASAYVFNGKNKKGSGDRIDNFGANLAYIVEGDRVGMQASAGYINDLNDSDSLQDALSSNTSVDYVPGWTAAAAVNAGPVTLIGEYVTATKAIAGLSNAKPAAWNLEADIGFRAFERDATVAVAYQGSRDASELELPEKRWLIGASIALLEGTAFGLELARDTAYDNTDNHTLTGLLAVEF